jgi:phospholipid transport system substrate-binding protein
MRNLTMTRFSRFYRLACVLFSLFLSSSLWAASGSPEDFLRDRHAQLVSILKQPKSAAREKNVNSAMDEVFDYGTMAERSLGEEWKNRSDAEKKQFRELLEGLVRKSYRRSIDSTLGWAVEYKGKDAKDTGTVVATTAKHKTDARKAPVSIDYALIQVDGKWRIVDVVIEGSSMVGNYRSQFTKLIRKKGFAELVAKMKNKLASNEG